MKRGKFLNYQLIIQYDGSRYDGWQRQGNTGNTIQGKLEEVLGRMLGEKIEIQGAGRTDAGVHALGQTANFHSNQKLDTEILKKELNRYLPEDIGIVRVQKVGERFHSRLNAVGKIYRYRIALGTVKNVFERKQIYLLNQELNLEQMGKAAEKMTGKRDFKGFSTGKSKKSTLRTLKEIRIFEENGEVVLEFEGDGFLYNMVRILTGTLLEVGMGKRDIESISEIFEKKDRTLAGFTAPARGLTLVKVFYPKGESIS